MNILIVNHVSAIGGAEISMESLLMGMSKNDYNYTVALPGNGPLVERLISKGIDVKIISLESWRFWVANPIQYLKFILKIPNLIFSLFRWVFFLRQLQPEIIHFNINRLIEPVIAARILKINCIMHFRDIPSRVTSRFILGKYMFYKIMNLTNHWVANSNATKNDIEPYAECPVKTIPNGVDLEKYNDLTLNITINQASKDTIRIAMIATIVPWKNYYGYLKLAQKVCNRRTRLEFLIVGTGDLDYIMELKQEAKNLGISNYVNFYGYVNDIPKILNKIDIVVHTTDREPFGRVFIEAMAACRPVIAFNNGGAAEIIMDKQTGILVEPGNYEEMANAVCYLCDHPDLRLKYGKGGRQRVKTCYTLETHCQAVADLYEIVRS